MNINIIGVPTFYGCDKLGPQLGPDKLREKGIIQTIKSMITKFMILVIYMLKVLIKAKNLLLTLI